MGPLFSAARRSVLPFHPARVAIRSAQFHRTQNANTANFKVRLSESQQERGSQSDINSVRQAQEDSTGIDRQSNEYSKTGSDDAVADLENVSFESSAKDDPESANERVNRAGNMRNNPLEVSPANRKVSEHTAEIAGDAGTHAARTPSTQSGSSYHAESSRKVKSSEQKKDFKGFDRRSKEEKESPHSVIPGSR